MVQFSEKLILLEAVTVENLILWRINKMKEFKEYLEAVNKKEKEERVTIHIPDYALEDDFKTKFDVENLFYKYLKIEEKLTANDIMISGFKLKNENGNPEFNLTGTRKNLQKWINKFYKTGDKETDSVDFYLN